MLATIFPIGILIVAVEARQLRVVKAPPGDPYRSRRAYWTNIRSWSNFLATVSVMGVMWPLGATILCTIAVCEDRPVRGGAVVLVVVAAIFSVAAVGLTLIRFISEPPSSPEE